MDIEIAFLKMVVNLCVRGSARAKQRILLSGEMCYAVLCISLPFLSTAPPCLYDSGFTVMCDYFNITVRVLSERVWNFTYIYKSISAIISKRE